MILKTVRNLYARIRAAEFNILLVFTLLVGALLGFAEVVDEVFDDREHGADKKIMLALRDTANLHIPHGPAWLRETMLDITSLGSSAVLAMITCAAIIYLLINKKSHAALFVFLSMAGGTLLMNMLKSIFQRPRPDVIPHLVEVSTYSFPSGHTLMATITYLTLGALLARVQEKRRMKAYILSVAVVLAVLVGCSRVYLGVHWPTDVLGGWLVGAAWAMLCWLLMRWFQSRGQVEEPVEKPD
jgi:undecaprenyl-diphosphatase